MSKSRRIFYFQTILWKFHEYAAGYSTAVHFSFGNVVLLLEPTVKLCHALNRTCTLHIL